MAHPGIVFVGLISCSLYLWNPFAMLIARNLAAGTVGQPLHLFVGLILTLWGSRSPPTIWSIASASR